MTSKQQERDALAKIRKIVEALGEDSYLGTAFKGVFDTAETNIEWDAAFSLAEELDAAREETKTAKAEAEKLRNQNQELSSELTAVACDRDCTADQLAEYTNLLNAQLARNTELEDENEAQAQTIIELKAKLFDLMTAGA